MYHRLCDVCIDHLMYVAMHRLHLHTHSRTLMPCCLSHGHDIVTIWPWMTSWSTSIFVALSHLYMHTSCDLCIHQVTYGYITWSMIPTYIWIFLQTAPHICQAVCYSLYMAARQSKWGGSSVCNLLTTSLGNVSDWCHWPTVQMKSSVGEWESKELATNASV